MCVVSYIGDEWNKRVPPQYPWINPWVEDINKPIPLPVTYPNQTFIQHVGVSKEEFNALKKEVEALKELLKAAKIYDETTGQKDCEMDEKVAMIKKIADIVGVDLEDVFGKK